MRTIIGHQLNLFPTLPEDTNTSSLTNRSGSFVDNMSLPIHRWFRYSAGFSANWVRSLIQERTKRGLEINKILDPFAGVGTTMIAAAAENKASVGFEPHPFVFRIADAKIKALNVNPQKLLNAFDEFIRVAQRKKADIPDKMPRLLQKCYTQETLLDLWKIKETLQQDFSDHPMFDFIWFSVNSILRSCSTAGTAQWQYVLPNKQKANVIPPFESLYDKFNRMIEDIIYAREHNWGRTETVVLQTDARNPDYNQEKSIDLVITSPPYPNNYDYADATRLEMTFWDEIEGWKDLHKKVRNKLITSCSQHSAAEKFELENLLQNPVLGPIQKELSEACHKLAEIRLQRGGRKTYHTMAAAYFTDLAEIFHALRSLCSENSEMCFVIGDSAPYGIYLKVDEWLGKLALAAGFKEYEFEKIRDRNVKWKNRKHRVPLKEGRLWIRG